MSRVRSSFIVQPIQADELGTQYPVLVMRLGNQEFRTLPKRQPSANRAEWEQERFEFAQLPLSQMYHQSMYVAVLEQRPGEADGREVCSFLCNVWRMPIGRELVLTFHIKDHPGRVLLNVELNGPLRPEVEKLLKSFNMYTDLVDQGVGYVAQGRDIVAPYVLNRYALLPAVPMSMVGLASLPLVVVVIFVGAPLLIPLFVVAAVVALLWGGFGLLLAASHRGGRGRIKEILSPTLTKMASNSVGQQLLYDTGPRPSVLRIMEEMAPGDMWPKLAASLVIDAIGSSSYAIPGLGEAADLAWAPMQAVLLNAMYSKSSPWAAYAGFAEEILPFTDIIPTATLAWLKEYAPQLYMTYKDRIVGGHNGNRPPSEVPIANPVSDSIPYERRH